MPTTYDATEGTPEHRMDGRVRRIDLLDSSCLKPPCSIWARFFL